MELSIAGDKHVNFYKIFFWIGCHAVDYDTNFEQTVGHLNELQNKGSNIKLRTYIEF
jgi:hypothetical protein